jgi:drug/metabolite transporter (DMT)-like permease
MTTRSTSPLAVWAGIVVLYLVWGSTYLAIRVAVGSIPPFLMGAMRFIPAGVLLMAGVVAYGRGAVRRPSLRETRDAAIVGACLIGGGMGVVSWAETMVPSGTAALLVALMPMWLGLFARAAFGERMAGRAVVGTVVGLAGVAVLAGPSIASGGAEAPGLVALLVSPMCWAAGSLYAARRAVLPKPALMASGAEMLLGGALLLVVATLTGELGGFSPGAVAPQAWAGLLYLITIGSLVGFVTFAWLIGVAPLPRVTTYAYVNPVVAVVLGAIILGEPLEPRTILASAIIVAGVVMIVSATGRRTASEPAERIAVEAADATTAVA